MQQKIQKNKRFRTYTFSNQRQNSYANAKNHQRDRKRIAKNLRKGPPKRGPFCCIIGGGVI